MLQKVTLLKVHYKVVFSLLDKNDANGLLQRVWQTHHTLPHGYPRLGRALCSVSPFPLSGFLFYLGEVHSRFSHKIALLRGKPGRDKWKMGLPFMYSSFFALQTKRSQSTLGFLTIIQSCACACACASCSHIPCECVSKMIRKS